MLVADDGKARELTESLYAHLGKTGTTPESMKACTRLFVTALQGMHALCVGLVTRITEDQATKISKLLDTIQPMIADCDDIEAEAFLKKFDKNALKKVSPLHQRLMDLTEKTSKELKRLNVDTGSDCADIVCKLNHAKKVTHQCSAMSIKWGIFTLLKKHAAGEDITDKIKEIHNTHFKKEDIMR